MARQWTDEEVKAEIAEAVKIVREDRERAEYARLHTQYGKPDSGDGGNNDDPSKPPAPPKKEGEGEGNGQSVDPGNTPKSSIWWGDRLNEGE